MGILSGVVHCWKKDYVFSQVDDAGAALLVGTGYTHGYSINEDLTVSCWGDNQTGELGNGSTEYGDSAVAVKNLWMIWLLAIAIIVT